ncbi:hypothetical protein E5673_08145 [Sphingomonas sp. PAMC26645]|uniref:hypothetical protein n=1 Tax=Sphingomonas sp. PAMC26645 TaxID=2565555 RepID=UPI00109E3181|nr:hypothetical protein [Sphingomonas sp. PAMC26645]QCB42205.1 hypothetical protein E5673_08145 [Sphingomonas sp. PAMC26645]
MNAGLAVRSKPAYIIVENSGMVGEKDVAKFGTQNAAWAWLNRTYSDVERDHESPHCLFPDVCLEQDGSRTYDI